MGRIYNFFPKVKHLLEKKRANNIIVIGRGIIPQTEKRTLERQGIKGNFGPGTTLDQIIEFIQSQVRPRDL